MGGGTTTTSDTTSNQVDQIPAWMSDAGQQNYAYAQQVAQPASTAIPGQMVADVAPQPSRRGTSPPTAAMWGRISTTPPRPVIWGQSAKRQ